MKILGETERLIIREFTSEDTDFVIALVNTPKWLEFIGDRNVNDTESAIRYIENIAKSYTEKGYGGWVLIEKPTGRKVGSCGFYKRDILDYPDLGFALLPEFEGKGYALEAARKCLEIAALKYQMKKVLAIATATNTGSVRLLEKAGFQKSGTMIWPETEEILLVMTYTK